MIQNDTLHERGRISRRGNDERGQRRYLGSSRGQACILRGPIHQHAGRSMNKERKYVPHEESRWRKGLVASSSKPNIQINMEGQEGHERPAGSAHEEACRTVRKKSPELGKGGSKSIFMARPKLRTCVSCVYNYQPIPRDINSRHRQRRVRSRKMRRRNRILCLLLWSPKLLFFPMVSRVSSGLRVVKMAS